MVIILTVAKGQKSCHGKGFFIHLPFQSVALLEALLPQRGLFLGRQVFKGGCFSFLFNHLFFVQASLTVSGTNVFCGASLVTDRHLVTAAHCLAGAFDVDMYLRMLTIMRKKHKCF